MSTPRIVIVTKANGGYFSLEAGIADGVRNFDHHGNHGGNPAPCRDDRIFEASRIDRIEITHIDADTFVGLLRMCGRDLPKTVDLALMEQIDLNGSSAVPDLFDPTLLYMVGVGEVARELRFPRASADGPIEVTALVEAMMAKTEEELIEIGRFATEASEATYANCREALSTNGKVGFWVIGTDDSLDPSRPYTDGVEIVVVFRSHYESVSIYCNPTSDRVFGGQMVGGIEFAGHPKACGSPRGIAFEVADARRVFDAIVANV